MAPKCAVYLLTDRCLQIKLEQAFGSGLTAPALLSKVTGTADRNGFLRHASGVSNSDFRGHARDVSRQLATCPHQLVRHCLADASLKLSPMVYAPSPNTTLIPNLPSLKPECHAVFTTLLAEAKFASLASERSECQSAKHGCQIKTSQWDSII